MNLSFTVTSKRKLFELIEEGHVKGWDDPRMPTISGLRRRGYTPTALKNFVETAGVAKRDNVIDLSLLEHSIREDLNETSPRVMAVLDPLKLTIVNYPEDITETLEGEINPHCPNDGKRSSLFQNIFTSKKKILKKINQKVFSSFLRQRGSLKNAYIIKEAESIVKDTEGNITEVLCTYDPESKSGSGSDASKRKVKGTLHWVTARLNKCRGENLRPFIQHICS